MNWQEKYDNRENWYVPQPWDDMQILFNLNISPENALKQGLITKEEFKCIQSYTGFMAENSQQILFKKDVN